MNEISKNTNYVLASRLKRLAAALIDAAAILLPVMCVVLLNYDFSNEANSENNKEVGSVVFNSVLIIFFIYITLNIILIIKKSATVGKVLLGMTIKRSNGNKCSASRIIFLRIIVNGIICSVPAVGTIYAIVDILFIFGEDRQCIHDLIADTIVVNSN